MAQRGIFFGGKQILIPGAYGTYRSVAQVPLSVAATNVVLLLGKSTAAEAYKPIVLANKDFDRATALLRGGDLLDAVELCMWPAGRNLSSDPNPGASDILAMRVTPALAGSLEIKNTANTLIGTIKHRDFGVHTNGTQVAISAGTVSGTLKATIQDLSLNLREESPDLGRCLKVEYLGNGKVSSAADAATGAVLTIDTTGLSVTMVGATDGSAPFALAFSNESYKTVEDLATYIAAQPKFTVTLLGSGKMAWNLLDKVTNGAVGKYVSASNDTSLILKGVNSGSLADWINRNSRLVKLDLETTPVLTAAVGQHAFKNLTGGADGDETEDGWKRALNVAKNLPVYIIVPIVTQPPGMTAGAFATLEGTIRDLVVAHVLAQRDIKVKKRRVAYLGHQRGLIGDDSAKPGTPTVDTLLPLVQALNSEAICFFTPGFTRTLASGKKTLSSYFVAAAAAGIKVGSPPQRPLTLREFKAEELEADFPNEVQEQLIKMGASYLIARRGKILFGIGQTTWLQDFDPVKSEPSLIHIGDTLTQTAEELLEARYGGIEFRGPSHIAAARADFLDVLEEAKNLGMLVDSIDPVTNSQIDAFRDAKVSFADRRWSFSAVTTAAEPGNYITIEFGFASAGQAAV